MIFIRKAAFFVFKMASSRNDDAETRDWTGTPELRDFWESRLAQEEDEIRREKGGKEEE